jgi:acyl-CoA dehydrogenase
VFAARIAAEAALADEGIGVHPLRAALAKARCGEAAEKVVAIAHAVHGAIGITGEYDLQLYTRRLQEWRVDFGSSAWWHAQLGAALLGASHASTLEFLLAELAPAATPRSGAPR